MKEIAVFEKCIASLEPIGDGVGCDPKILLSKLRRSYESYKSYQFAIYSILTAQQLEKISLSLTSYIDSKHQMRLALFMKTSCDDEMTRDEFDSIVSGIRARIRGAANDLEKLQSKGALAADKAVVKSGVGSEMHGYMRRDTLTENFINICRNIAYKHGEIDEEMMIDDEVVKVEYRSARQAVIENETPIQVQASVLRVCDISYMATLSVDLFGRHDFSFGLESRVKLLDAQRYQSIVKMDLVPHVRYKSGKKIVVGGQIVTVGGISQENLDL